MGKIYKLGEGAFKGIEDKRDLENLGYITGKKALELVKSYLCNNCVDREGIEKYKKYSKMLSDNLDKVQAINWLREKVIRINELIFDYVNKHPESKGMGTTLVMAVLTTGHIIAILQIKEQGCMNAMVARAKVWDLISLHG